MKIGDTVILKEDFRTFANRYVAQAGTEFEVIDIIKVSEHGVSVRFNLDINGVKYKAVLPSSRFRARYEDGKLRLLDEAARVLGELGECYELEDVFDVINGFDDSKLIDRIQEVLDE